MRPEFMTMGFDDKRTSANKEDFSAQESYHTNKNDEKSPSRGTKPFKIYFLAFTAGLLFSSINLIIFSSGQWANLNGWDSWIRHLLLMNHEQPSKDGSSHNPLLVELWDQISPNKELVYHACFDGFQCARVDLPMDWNSSEAAESHVTLAIAKLPGKVTVMDPRYGGILWLQSGGPGESGIDFLLRYGRTIQTIVDSDIDPLDTHHDPQNPSKYFDIIGIDSRGINNSIPRFTCFPTAPSRDHWRLASSTEGILGSSEASFPTLWARMQALGRGCSARAVKSDWEEEKLAYHVNTTPQISDMKAILELHGQWREKQARRWQSGQEANHLSEEEVAEVINRTRWKKGQEKLLFWGFSYGTVIGATFAAMQPHRVERAVFDGVVDTPDYYRGERLHNVQDADSILESLCKYCDKAGPQLCALYIKGGSAKIRERFIESVEALKDDPLSVPASGSLAPDIITYSDVKRAIFHSLYAPIQDFPTFMKRLADISNRNGSSFAAAKQQGQISSPFPLQCLDARPYDQECSIPRQTSGETRMAILCTDSNSTSGMTRPAFKAYFEHLRQQSWLIGDVFAQVRMQCVGWDLKPSWRFPGPYSGQTAHPMLMVGTTRDPVTSIRNAQTVAERFKGSVVLAVDGEGHCSLSAPALCMARHIRRYFQTGELPHGGTVCEANEKPFLGVTMRGVDRKEEELLEKLRWVAKHWS